MRGGRGGTAHCPTVSAGGMPVGDAVSVLYGVFLLRTRVAWSRWSIGMPYASEALQKEVSKENTSGDLGVFQSSEQPGQEGEGVNSKFC